MHVIFRCGIYLFVTTSVMRGTNKSLGLVCDYILSIIRNGLDGHNLIETTHIFLFDNVNDKYLKIGNYLIIKLGFLIGLSASQGEC